ncbi:hypothetical protein PsYK624_130770 [Phanerochaete sordida]|uniref:Uncharacterized protein n=1 Tax=Phanerochaete sordida TaxID=48140 RepID=A0A9P3GNW5_9APHY|nr:hypothetical protein PsYK624_130770 [Phanerochaete sordida]
MSTVALQLTSFCQAIPSLDSRAIPRRATSPLGSPASQSTAFSRPSGSLDVASQPTHFDPPSPATANQSQSDTAIESSILRIVQIAPQDVQILKYHRSTLYPSDPEDSTVKGIKPLQLTFEREITLMDWKEIRQGRPYFHDSRRSLLTRSDLYDNDELVDIQLAAGTMVERLDSVRDKVPADAEIVLAKTYADGEPVIGYYIASMSMQVVFWLGDPDGDGQDPITTNLVTDWGSRAVVSQPHLGLAVRWQFWVHVELFPAHRPLPPVALEELKRAFNFGLCDSITSSNSMFPYDSDTNTRLAKCRDNITAQEVGEAPGTNLPSGAGGDVRTSAEDGARPPSISTVAKNIVRKGNSEGTFITARLLATLYHDRFLSFWGETGARRTRSESALDCAAAKRSWVFKRVSPIFFFMPFVYMQEFDQLYVDRTIHYHPWRIFIEGLKKDWENSITPATVLIATNIGFLSIGSIDGDGMAKNGAAQIMSYISTILAASIYIVCQILQRHHRHHVYGQATDALSYISRRADRLMGLETVAIAFSIPTALFLWSMITFLVAMIIVFFDRASLGTRLSLGVLLGLLLLILVLLLYLESQGSFRNTFNILGLAKRACGQVSTWWQARPLHPKTPADDVDVESGQSADAAASVVSETLSGRKRSRLRSWLSTSKQASSESNV